MHAVIVACAVSGVALQPTADGGATGYARVLATVNGDEITTGQVELLAIRRNVPDALKDRFRKRLVQTLIERRLVRDHLKRQGVKVSTEAVNQQLQATKELLKSRLKLDADAVLERFGIDEQDLRNDLETTVAWTSFTRRTISRDRMRKFYREHRHRFDGTRLRARQIMIKVDSDADADWTVAERKLIGLRTRIRTGAIDFAEAARTESQAPSAKDGGDVGQFQYRGRMPSAFSKVAFALKVDEISGPFRTEFGVHIVQVTERQPGDLSLEDVRSTVFEQLSRELWNEIVAGQKKSAEIEMMPGAEK